MTKGKIYDVRVRTVVGKSWTTTMRLRFHGILSGRSAWWNPTELPDVYGTKPVLIDVSTIDTITEVGQ